MFKEIWSLRPLCEFIVRDTKKLHKNAVRQILYPQNGNNLSIWQTAKKQTGFLNKNLDDF